MLLTYRVVAVGAPFAPDYLDRTVSEALNSWEDTGVVAFHRAPDDAPPSFTISWHGTEDEHDDCRPFGLDRSVAHSGPVAAGSFIHLDATHGWTNGNGPGESLERTLRHELGHVLGLGHCADASALMAPGTSADEPTESDLAGLHSLYGGHTDNYGDLVILRPETHDGESIAPSLRRIAPPGVTDWTVLDTDADGDDEVLVWRTDAAGVGALLIYHFADGPLLEHTVGPFLGVVPPDAETSFRRGLTGERWIVTNYQDGLLRLRRFDANGWIQTATPEEHLSFDAEATASAPEPRLHPGDRACSTLGLRCDLDGDGLFELALQLTTP